jgi:hypothetical protein
LEQSRVTAAANAKGSDAAQAFWRSFMGSDTEPVVGYADAVYLVDGAEDLFRFRRGASDNTGTAVEPHLAQQFASSPGLVAKAGPLYYEDGNTGTGDLQSVFVLTRLFTQMGMNMTVKRCRLITIDDLQQHVVILLGSPEENDAVEQLSQPSEFVWNRLNVPGPWKGEYVNVHPQAGEGTTFKTERDPNTQEIKTDYGLITAEPVYRNFGRAGYLRRGWDGTVYDLAFGNGRTPSPAGGAWRFEDERAPAFVPGAAARGRGARK